MKKWFVMFLVSLMLMACSDSVHAEEIEKILEILENSGLGKPYDEAGGDIKFVPFDEQDTMAEKDSLETNPAGNQESSAQIDGVTINETPVRMSSEVRIQFEYNDGKEEDLNQVNQMLAVMELTDMEVEDIDVYLAKTQQFEQEAVVSTAYRCGLSNGSLICKKEDGGNVYQYQIAAEAFEKGTTEAEEFEDYWREMYPERRLDTLIVCEFDTHKAFVVVYCEEISK